MFKKIINNCDQNISDFEKNFNNNLISRDIVSEHYSLKSTGLGSDKSNAYQKYVNQLRKTFADSHCVQPT